MPACSANSSTVACAEAFSAHSLSSTLGARMLREAEEHGTRNFALGDGGREPRLLLTLLCPYLALHTNRPQLSSRAAASSRPHSQHRVATDALKVLWAWLGPAEAWEAGSRAGAVTEGEVEPDATALVVWQQWEKGGSALRMRLLAGECEEVRDGLHETGLALPPSTRRVGAFLIGHLPIVPSWD